MKTAGRRPDLRETNYWITEQFCLKQNLYRNPNDCKNTPQKLTKEFQFQLPYNLLTEHINVWKIVTKFVLIYVSWLHELFDWLRCLGLYFSYIFILLSYTIICGVTQVPTVGPSIFTAFINDICEAICSSSCLLCADDLKICHSIKNVVDDTVCSLLCCLDNSETC